MSGEIKWFMLNCWILGIARSDCMGDYILANGQQFCGETLDNGMLQGWIQSLILLIFIYIHC